ncbi:MAG TPA: hypothetical protein VHS31_02115 [Tepidisphaeraceae bacterium]|jgi:hypothetical protein|nr:hypothetical protein [Tepidisphaeraceae bacterium]
MSETPGVNLASPAVTPASPQHLEQIAAARKRGKKIKRCASTALFSAWTIAIFGALTLITSIGSFYGMMLGAGMCVLSHYEFRGAKEVRRLDPTAPRRLARNQMIMCVLLLAYSVGSMHAALSGPSEIDQALGSDPQVRQMLGSSISDLEKEGAILLYCLVGVAAIVGCGGTAWYYATRKRYIEAYVRETPAWIVQLEQAGMTVY